MHPDLAQDEGDAEPGCRRGGFPTGPPRESLRWQQGGGEGGRARRCQTEGLSEGGEASGVLAQALTDTTLESGDGHWRPR